MRFGYLLIACLVATAGMAQVAVTGSEYPTSVGPAIGIGTLPSWSPLLTTPQITFVNSTSSPVGATNATANNTAGARNSTLMNIPGPGAASISVPRYIDSAGMPFFGYSQEEQPEETMLSLAPTPSMFLRFGAMQTDSAYNSLGPPPGVPTVAEAAQMAKEREQSAHQVRTYTNADITRLQQQSGVKGPPGFTIPAPPTGENRNRRP